MQYRYSTAGVLYGYGGGKLEQGSGGGLWLTARCKDAQRGVACFSGCYDNNPDCQEQLRREQCLR